MKKFKIGEVYRVGIGEGKGDHIKITSVTVHPGDCVKYKCETVFGSSNPVKVFMGGSLFAERLEPVEKLKTGEVYRVGSDGREKGNIIRITGQCSNPVGITTYLYKTLEGWSKLYGTFEEGSAFARGLEPVESERKIVITTDGKTTIAKLYDGRKTIREAKAVCSDADTFDFNVGAGIALARLTGRPFLGVDLPQPEYNPDDVRLTKPKTLRDVVAERDPDKIDPEAKGGVFDCPCDYAYLRESTGDSRTVCPRGKDGCQLSCSDCWDRPYTPKEEAKQGRENLVSPELKQQLLNEFKDAYIRTLSVLTKIRATTNEKTGGTNHE